ncbi:MAG: hypothetical protein WCM93_16725, partial [Bacteroidota bacterium]
MQRAANAYNDQTSDRRLYINTLSSYSSANGVMGPVTHDNISDNEQYELLSPENIYDNGYHLFVNGVLLEMDGNGMMRIATGDTDNFDRFVGDTQYNVGDWYDNSGPDFWKIMSKTLNTPVITAPVAIPITSPPPSAVVTTGVGTVTPGQVNTIWQYGPIVQDPNTGYATQTWTRNCTKNEQLAPVTQAVPITQITQTQLGTYDPADDLVINGTHFHEYTYTDYTNTQVTSYAIGDQNEAQAITQLNALANFDTSITNNFILMQDVDMSSNPNWSIIEKFDGTFDGNLHKISNLNIQPAMGTEKYIGMFGEILTNGKVKNLTLENTNIDVFSNVLNGAWNQDINYNYIGAVAGQSTGAISNCHVTNLDMYIKGEPGYSGPGVKIGGVVGESGKYVNSTTTLAGLLTNCSADGNINLTGEGHQVGGLAGLSSGGTIQYSSADVNIKTNTNGNLNGLDGNSSHIGSLIGDIDNGGNGNTTGIEYCYASGLINGHPGSIAMADDALAIGLSHPDTLSKHLIKNSYYGEPGTGNNPPTTLGVYDGIIDPGPNPANGGKAPDAGATWNDIKNATATVGGQTINVWNPNGTLNTAAINTQSGTFPTKRVTTWTETETKTHDAGVNYDGAEFINSTFDPTTLEPGLKDGTIKLAKHADPMTQEVISPAGSNEKFEYVDWRLVPIIADDLYEANDEKA